MKQRLRILWITAMILIIVAVFGDIYAIFSYFRGMKGFIGIPILANLCFVLWIFVMNVIFKESKQK
ncbi:MAG: hypothetical protein K0R34_3729 [Herbinix sp.]|jgi:hypothetical protein|nr:hypothetical protein [Herbinix sp.]